MNYTSPSDRIDYLDALRAVAFLGVLCVHTAQQTQLGMLRNLADSGQYGVQLFFVVSAFTLMYTISRYNGTPVGWLVYYAKRYMRIAPLFYISAVVYSCSPGNYYIPTIPLSAYANILNSITFTSPTSQAVPGGWSICCEIYFYIMLPVIAKYAKCIASSMAFFWIAVLLMIFVNGVVLESLPYFSFVNHLPVFAAGIVVFHLSNLRIGHRILDQIGAVKTFSLIVLSCVVIPHQSYSLYSHLLYVPVFGAMTLVAEATFSEYPKGLVFSFFRLLGRSSYAAYLSHFMILRVVAEILEYRKFKATLGVVASPVYFACFYVVSLMLSFAAAAFLTRYIDAPLQRFLRRCVL